MSDRNPIKSAKILLVEDSPTDALLTQEALAATDIPNDLHLVTDGVEALAFLRQERQYAHQVRPDLILLDLNLPKKNGIEVLQELKTDDKLKSIPVIILTTSKAEEDIVKSYHLHANCYVIKPVDFDKFSEAVQTIRNFWLSIVTLPPRKHTIDE
jgi:two-component system, chemotaxis family, response regulator Rcp1